MSLENAVGIAARAVTGNAAKVCRGADGPSPFRRLPFRCPKFPAKIAFALGRLSPPPPTRTRVFSAHNPGRKSAAVSAPQPFHPLRPGPVALRLGCGSAAQCSAQLCDPVGICDLIVLPAFRVDRTEHAGKGGGAQTIPLYENTEISRPAGCCCGCGLSLHLGGSRGGLRAGRRPPDLDLSEHEVR